MADYKLTLAADHDIEAIARLSIETWGLDRAETYVMDLHRAFETLAGFPALGRDIGTIRAGYFRFEHESHVVFYQRSSTGIIVIRVLHRRQLPPAYL